MNRRGAVRTTLGKKGLDRQRVRVKTAPARDGWSGEMRIPFSLLGAHPRDNAAPWRLSVARGDHSTWSSVQNQADEATHFGYVSLHRTP